MSINPHVVSATKEHCELLAPRLRVIDKQEIFYAGGLRPKQALEYSLENSLDAITVKYEGSDIPILMAGISNNLGLMDDRKNIWLLASDEINNISFKFLKQCNNYMLLLAKGNKVCNHVMEGNNITLKWLKWLGFTIYEPKPFGLYDKRFHYIEKDLR